MLEFKHANSLVSIMSRSTVMCDNEFPLTQWPITQGHRQTYVFLSHSARNVENSQTHLREPQIDFICINQWVEGFLDLSWISNLVTCVINFSYLNVDFSSIYISLFTTPALQEKSKNRNSQKR